MRLLAMILLIVSFQSLAGEVVPCGESNKEKELGNWFELGKVNIKAPFVRLKGVLCAASLERGGPVELLTYRDDFGSLRFFKVSEFSKGSKVILRGSEIRIPLVKKGDLFSLRVQSATNQQNTTGYLYKVDLRFDRILGKSSTDKREMSFWVRKSDQKDEGTTAVKNDFKETFNSLNLSISTGLKIKSIEVKDFNISRKKWKATDLKSVPTL